MSEYTQALAELASLPRLLAERLVKARHEADAERERREAEIQHVASDHEAVVSRLEAVLERARAEGLAHPGRAQDGQRHDDPLAADPVEYARQLVRRLEEALAHFTHTRDALATEEAKLSESERRKAADERRRREREELRRGERWERARQGTIGIVVALAAAAVAGSLGGVTGSPVALLLPVFAGAACLIQAASVTSTLPALAVKRASGSMPLLPEAPPREAHFAAAGNAAVAMALCAAGMTVTAVLAVGAGLLAVGALLLLACGIAGVAVAWIALPHQR